MRSDTRPRPVGQGDPVRDPARAAALGRLSTVLGSPGQAAAAPPRTVIPAPPLTVISPTPGPASSAPTTGGASTIGGSPEVPAAPWAVADPDGVRPERVPPESPDLAAWADPPWWARIRWAPDKIAGVALVVLVVALGAFSVNRLLASVPDPAPVPELPLAAPGETVPADGNAMPDPTSATGTSASPAPAEPAASEEVVVSVVGLVGRSGLVTLAPDARVADALDSAGGVLEGGDRDGLNLARKVVDGEQILVGLSPGPDGPRGPRSAIVGSDGGPAPEAGGPAASGSSASPGGSGEAEALVNINTADATALETLPGVGPVTASSILAWRTAHGTFTSVDQLAEVDGIGQATLARLRPLVAI